MTADIEIRLAGFPLFSPSVWKPARPARRDGRAIRPARPARIEALFPRYSFVQFRRADDWQRIRDLPGVDCILGTAPDSPIALPDAAIDFIRGLCWANGCQYPRGVNPANLQVKVDLNDLYAALPIKVGANARLLNGPLADLTGICQMSAGKRLELLSGIMGGARITVSRAAVEAF